MATSLVCSFLAHPVWGRSDKQVAHVKSKKVVVVIWGSDIAGPRADTESNRQKAVQRSSVI